MEAIRRRPDAVDGFPRQTGPRLEGGAARMSLRPLSPEGLHRGSGPHAPLQTAVAPRPTGLQRGETDGRNSRIRDRETKDVQGEVARLIEEVGEEGVADRL